MEKDIQDARTSNGKRVGYVKVDDRSILISNKIGSWQLALLAFILVASILMSYVTMTFIGDGFNRLLYEIYDIKSELGMTEGYILTSIQNEKQESVITNF